MICGRFVGKDLRHVTWMMEAAAYVRVGWSPPPEQLVELYGVPCLGNQQNRTVIAPTPGVDS